MPDFEVREVSIPSSIADPDAADFIRASEVGRTVEAIAYGSVELAYEPDEELPAFHASHEEHRMLVAEVAGAIVGRGHYQARRSDDGAWLLVEVLPEFRGRGIGTALAGALEAMAAAAGKRRALAYSPVPPSDGEQLHSPTGFGSIAADHPNVRFLLGRGYRLEQLERVSRLALPVRVRVPTVPGFRLHTWVGPTPERWRAGLALLQTRMSTDAPTAGLGEGEDPWTAERVAEADERDARLNPRRKLTAAVEHEASGTLAGFTLLSVPRATDRAVEQDETLVLREHRGHGVGMLLKLANLAQLGEVAPGHPAVITFNAEENRHMLDVNEALGFVPIAYESSWRKNLPLLPS